MNLLAGGKNMKCRICDTDTENGWDGKPMDICPVCSKNEFLKKAKVIKSEKLGLKYKAAQGVSGFIELIGWLVVIGGGIVAIGSVSGGALFLLPGIGITISGLFLVMGAQVTKATVDNANNTREIIKLLKRRDENN
jgi:hypothetical protein